MELWKQSGGQPSQVAKIREVIDGTAYFRGQKVVSAKRKAVA